MAERIDVVVVGAGQAGLAVSHQLSERGVEHVVLERGRIGQSWRDRWESFCLVTPNWSVQLPGGGYEDDDPDGFMPRDKIVAHLERYASGFDAPVRGGVEVTGLGPAPEGGFELATSAGRIRAKTVVLGTGAYQRPHRPAGSDTLSPDLLVIDAEGYTTPAALPPGGVLVVGSGQTGCQLTEELHHAGRDVFLACGRAPWCPRRVDGRDILSWLVEAGFMDATVASLPSPAARLVANVQVSGHDGGHDLNHRTLQAMGVTLLGHFRGMEDGRLHFASDLAESVAFGDSRYAELCGLIRATCSANGLPVPELPEPEPLQAGAPDSIETARLSTVIFTCGFRPDYSSWVSFPDAFDQAGFPVQADGASTVVEGLHFIGVHFLRKRKSSLLLGVGEDAVIVAEEVAKRAGVALT